MIYTDISRDGTLGGTNLEAYRKLTELEGLEIIASGGISSVKEIEALKDMGVGGAILGKAVYDGKLDLGMSLRAAGDMRDELDDKLPLF